MSTEDIKDWLLLNMIPGVGSLTFQRLIKFFGSPSKVLGAPLKELAMVRGITPAVCQSIVENRAKIKIDKELELIEKHDCKIVTIEDQEYPQNLKAIHDPPPLLYVKGKLANSDSNSIAVVGTRNATTYGKTVAEKLSGQLASRGITIVSGLAHGIDTYAHKGALDAGGRTIAVLGNGLDIIYPAENAKLFEEIACSGAIISELPMRAQPRKEMFPQRNRIISGMSLGTLVIEAPRQSGALITADLALEQGRDVFAVPGQIFSEASRGTNWLIKQGAKLVDSIEDVLEELPSSSFRKPLEDNLETEDMMIESQLSQDEKTVWNVISSSPIHIDDISKRSNLPVFKVCSVLVMLELKGLVQQLSGKMFIRKLISY